MAAGSGKQSAGVLVFRRTADGGIEVLLGHMGGPFWAKKDAGAWSIVKGEYVDGEEPWAAARREFAEETGHEVPEGRPLALGTVRQTNGKTVRAWALEGAFDPDTLVPGTFIMEWPPRSGRQAEFPELDRVAWMDAVTARQKIVKAQAVFVTALEAALDAAAPGD